MKAAVIKGFGKADVLELDGAYPMPEVLKNQVLIKVHAAGVNPLDVKIRKGALRFFLGSKFPMILGNEFSGVVEKCGREVRRFKVGDCVYGMMDSNEKFACSGFAKSGSYAEYGVTREDTLSLKPSVITDEEAAALPLCCLTAYQALVDKAGLKKGDKVLINGASGGVGVYALQIAKAFEAEVTAVCSSKNLDFVRALGADVVMDHKEKAIDQLAECYDVVYDVASTASYAKCKSILSPKGIYLSNIANPMIVATTYVQPLLKRFGFKKRSTYVWVKPSGDKLSVLSKMVEEKKIRPIVGKIFTLDEVRDAHLYLEAGKNQGKVVIGISHI